MPPFEEKTSSIQPGDYPWNLPAKEAQTNLGAEAFAPKTEARSDRNPTNQSNDSVLSQQVASYAYPNQNYWNQGRQDVVNIPTLRVEEQANPNDFTAYSAQSPLAQVYLNSRDSVVKISVDNTGPVKDSVGTGFFVTSDGYVATDYHVVEGGGTINITTTDGRNYAARVAATDKSNDLAVLKVVQSGPDQFQALTLGDSRVLQRGSQVVALGHPHGWGDVFMSPGVRNQSVSFSDVFDWKSRPLPDGMNPNRRVDQEIMHTRSGNSGGPVLDMSGRVIGIAELTNANNRQHSTPVEPLRNLLTNMFAQQRSQQERWAYSQPTQPYYSQTVPPYYSQNSQSYYGERVPAPRPEPRYVPQFETRPPQPRPQASTPDYPWYLK